MSSSAPCQSSEAQYWFNEVKHPALKLKGIAFPAYILPTFIPIVYLLSRPSLHHGRAGSATSANEAETNTLHQKGVKADAETHILSQQEEHPRWKKWLRNTVRIYHHLWTFQALLVQQSNPYKLYSSFYCHAEAIALVLTGCILERDTTRSRVAAATGWVVCLFQERIGYASIPTSVGMSALAAPCAWTLGQTDNYWSPSSAILLLVLTADPYIAADSPIRTPKFLGGELWPLGILVLIALAKAAPHIVRQVTNLGDDIAGSPWRHAKDFATVVVPEIANGLARAILILSVLAMAFGFTGFCCSSLGWSWVIDGRPANAPAFGPAVAFGGMLFLVVWSGMIVLHGDRLKGMRSSKELNRYAIVICADAVVSTIVCLTGLWVVFAVCEGMSGRPAKCWSASYSLA